MSMYKNAVSLAVLAAVTAPAAMADQAALDDNSMIETVVVTAQKRAQDPVEVPFALTAYSGKFLEDVGVQEFEELSLFVPGFQVQNQSPNNPGFVMRGITSDSGDAYQEPRVSVFQDGISISKSRGSYVELFDLERIEAAKGPQSTLFGRSALIGGVNIITNKAKLDQFEASVGIEAGNYNYRMIEGVMNVPVTDTLAVRAAVRYKSRDGYVENLNGGQDYNSTDTLAARISAAWAPTDKFRADLILNFQHDAPSGTSFKSGTYVPTDPTTGTAVGTIDHTSGATLSSGQADFEDGQELGLSRNVYSATLLTSYQFSKALTLSSATAYRRFEGEEVFDPDGSSLNILLFAEDARGDQFSHEMRLNYDDGGMIGGFIGFSYFYENDATRVPMLYNENMALALLTGQITSTPQASAFFSSAYYPLYATSFLTGIAYNYGAAPTACGMYTDYTSAPCSSFPGIAANLDPAHWEQYTNYGKTKSFDLYGDVTIRATDKLEFEAGLRYTHDDKMSGYAGKVGSSSALGGFIGLMSYYTNAALYEAAGDAVTGAYLRGQGNTALYYLSLNPSYVSDFGIAVQPTVNNGGKVTRNYSDDGFAWRLTARYALTETSSVYANYARGRRPKVLAAASPSSPYADPNFTEVDAETVDSYEIGYKTLALNGKLRLDASLYWYDYSNFQTSILQGTEIVTTNAGKANAYGAELAVNWAMAPWADLFATYAYSHARFGGDSIYKDNMFRLNPDNKLSFGLSLRHNAFGGTFNFMPTYTWQSKIFFDDDNDKAALQSDHLLPDTVVDEYQKAYGLLNLRLSFQQEGQPWNISLFASNVLDQGYIKDAGNTGDAFGIPTLIAGEPRYFGMSFTYKFN